jgi:hypothetical protein
VAVSASVKARRFCDIVVMFAFYPVAAKSRTTRDAELVPTPTW